MRYRTVLALALFCVTLNPHWVDAQGRRNDGGPRGPKTTTQSPKSTPQARRPAGSPTAKRGPNTTAPRGNTSSAGPKTRTATETNTRAARSRTDTTPTADVPAALPKNPRLVERLQALLPAGTDVNTAAEGFRNQGQFVAAVHVSNNLGIAFDDVKTRIVDDGMSLGQAIQTLKPGADADGEVTRATRQANDDLKPASKTTKRRQR